ncbi:MAG: hypothetical protein J7M12_04585, partial [Candidatus Hydrogenedentes bacterium]|nr:hypothetical protein [Candidatus Hydrogenedentota bacterium]
AFTLNPEFPPVLEALIEEAIDEETDGKLIVRTAQNHVNIVRRWLDAHHRNDVEIVADPVIFDGVVVEDAAHTFRITNTLTVRFEMLRDKIRSKCIEILSQNDNAGIE